MMSMPRDLCVRYSEEFIDGCNKNIDRNVPIRMFAVLENFESRNKIIYSLFNRICSKNDIAIIVFDNGDDIINFCKEYIPIGTNHKIITDYGETMIAGKTDIQKIKKFYNYYVAESVDFYFLRFGSCNNLFCNDEEIVKKYLEKYEYEDNKKIMVMLTWDDLNDFISILPNFYNETTIFFKTFRCNSIQIVKDLYLWESSIKNIFSFVKTSYVPVDIYNKYGISLGCSIFDEKKHFEYDREHIKKNINKLKTLFDPHVCNYKKAKRFIEKISSSIVATEEIVIDMRSKTEKNQDSFLNKKSQELRHPIYPPDPRYFDLKYINYSSESKYLDCHFGKIIKTKSTTDHSIHNDKNTKKRLGDLTWDEAERELKRRRI